MTKRRMRKILGYLSERVYDESGDTLPEIQRILDEITEEQFSRLKQSSSGLQRHVESVLAARYPDEYAAA